MVSTDSVNTGDLLAKLSRLEEQVAALSAELAVNNETISTLNQTLTTRQTQISELEAALIIAQQTLLVKTKERIQNLKQRTQSQMYDKALMPAVEKIQQQVETLKKLILDSKDFMNKKIHLINHHIHSTSAMLRQWPAKTKAFLEVNVVEKQQAYINELVVKLNGYLQLILSMTEQKIILPANHIYTSTLATAKKAPGQIKNIYQKNLYYPAVGLVEEIYEYFKDLFLIVKNLIVAVTYKLADKIKMWLEQLKAFIQNFISKYSHGGGNIPDISATYA
jgi:chromosome segregation ATPase